MMNQDAAIAEVYGEMKDGIFGDGSLAIEALGLSSGANVLDVGTGEGRFASFLALQGMNVLTGEPANDTTHYAGKDWSSTATKLGVRDKIRFEAFDASNMPFDDAAFDGVFFFGVLHHVDEGVRQAVVKEALRVAKSGVVYLEPSPALLEKVWEKDPDHPLAANPNVYLSSEGQPTVPISGQMMDIYIYLRGR